MSRIPNIHGGGARTNANGLLFEQTTSLNEALENRGYQVIDCSIYRKDGFMLQQPIGMSVAKTKLYTHFLEPRGIDYRNYNSKRWLPDEAFINYNNATVYIIEKKFQSSPGSVDEKLPNCHFKKWEYQKLFNPLNMWVEYVYLLNNWFRADQYKDTLDYIELMGCHYFFNEIPLNVLGLS